MPRFVVLHHVGHGPPHYDLMLEIDGQDRLRTWRLPAWPPADGDDAEELPPHRRGYLDYEGPISRDRGTVRRVASGTWTSVEGLVVFSDVPGRWCLPRGHIHPLKPADCSPPA